MTTTGSADEYRAAMGSGSGLPSDIQAKMAGYFTDFSPEMGSAAMPGGGALGGLVRGMQAQTRPGFEGLMQGQMPASISKHAVPGVALPQMAPNMPAGLSVAGTSGMPTPANQSATMTVKTTPTGENLPAGPIAQNNYPKLRSLSNQAYGVNHGNF